MRQSTFAVLSLLLLVPSLATAAPHESISSPSTHGHHLSTNAVEYPHKRTQRPWRRLSDALNRHLWGHSEGEQKRLSADSNTPDDSGDLPAPQLLARYGEDMVLRFNISTTDDASALAEAADVLYLDVWEFNKDWVDIRIAKDTVPLLLGLLPSSLQNSHVPLMQDFDLAQAILNSYPSPSATQLHDNDRSYSSSLKHVPSSGEGRSSRQEHPFFQDYQPLSVINPWMSLMSSMFTTHVRRINVGISYEGRDISALRVGVHPTNGDQPSSRRKTVLVTGGSHAREWISTSTVNYLAWSLINSYGKVQPVTKLLESFDFVFVPTLNPDGYVYSWETDRLWRKNRQPTSLRFCRGLDLDRSYSYKWEGESTRSNPCSESYAGDGPFDGVEVQRFAAWAKNETENNNVDFVGFLDLHSYSQQILYPYSYSCSDEPPTIEDLEELALGLAKAIRISRKGRPYKVTAACEGNVVASKNAKNKKDRVVLPRLESSGGSALDWFYHELRVKYAFQIKLRDTGSYGFLLPRENIVPTGEEVLGSILYLGRFMLGEVGFAAEGDASDPEGPQKKTENSVEVVEETDTQFELRRKR